MPALYFCALDTLEQKLQIERRLGKVKATMYFSLFRRFLSFKISKCEFDRLCKATIGRDVIPLHNHLVRSILKKACTSKTSPPRKGTVHNSWNLKMQNGSPLDKDITQSPKKGRNPNLGQSRFRDYLSPLVSCAKSNCIAIQDPIHKIHEHQSTIELQSICDRPPLYVEDGEEVYQIINYQRSHVEAPLGIPTHNKSAQRILKQGLVAAGIGELPDTCSLTKGLERELQKEGLNITIDAANLINNALDVYLKRLIKPCLDLASYKSVNKFSGPIQPGLNSQPWNNGVQNPTGGVSTSIYDLLAAMELNPGLLGEGWPVSLEKVWLRDLKE